MTPTLPDRRQPRQELVRDGDRLWDRAALRDLMAGWDARAERRTHVRRLSAQEGGR